MTFKQWLKEHYIKRGFISSEKELEEAWNAATASNDYLQTNAALMAEVARLKAEVDELMSFSNTALLYAVEKKYPNETRHETALRYIRQAENKECGEAKGDVDGKV